MSESNIVQQKDEPQSIDDMDNEMQFSQGSRNTVVQPKPQANDPVQPPPQPRMLLPPPPRIKTALFGGRSNPGLNFLEGYLQQLEGDDDR